MSVQWEKREYLGNARTAEPHLPQTGTSLEYKKRGGDDNDISDAGMKWRPT